MKIILPSFLRPYKVDDLIRVGKSNDGGYVIRKSDLASTDYLISLGISFDFSFERDFLKKNKYIKINTYDGSVGFKFFKKNFLVRFKNLIKNPSKKNLKKFLERFILIYQFSLFFKFNLTNKRKHIEKFISNNTKSFSDFKSFFGYEPEVISFEEIIPNNAKNLFFSIDIEGSEYNLLDKICSFNDRIVALNIEFHSVNENLDKIEKFLQNCNLFLVHTHINNFGPILNGTPSVIELSLSSLSDNKAFDKNEFVNFLPIGLDQPNNENGYDYDVVFQD